MHSEENNTDKLLNSILKEEPGFVLADNFAELVAKKMERHFAWKEYLHEFVVYLAALLGIVFLFAVMALIWFEIDWMHWWDFLLENASLVAGINLLAVFVLFADRVLLRYFMFRASLK